MNYTGINLNTTKKRNGRFTKKYRIFLPKHKPLLPKSTVSFYQNMGIFYQKHKWVLDIATFSSV